MGDIISGMQDGSSMIIEVLYPPNINIFIYPQNVVYMYLLCDQMILPQNFGTLESGVMHPHK